MKKILVIVLLLSMYFVGQALGYATSYVRQVNSGKVLSTEKLAAGIWRRRNKAHGQCQ